MDKLKIDPTNPQPPSTCPPGTVGKTPWCWYPTVRQFATLTHCDRTGKPSSARVVSSWCMLLASILVVGLVLDLPTPDYLEGWFYALITAATGVNAAGRLGNSK